MTKSAGSDMPCCRRALKPILYNNNQLWVTVKKIRKSFTKVYGINYLVLHVIT